MQHELGQLLEELEATDNVNPLDVLLNALNRAAAMAAVLGLQVAKLGPDGLVGPDHLGDLRQHPTVVQYREWNGEAARLGRMAVEHGLDERRVELAEEDARRLVDVLMLAIDAYRNALLEAAGDIGLVDAVSIDAVHKLVPEFVQRAITATSTEVET